mgnify:CR=1 FL=1
MSSRTSKILVLRHEQGSSLGMLENQTIKQQQIPLKYLEPFRGETLDEAVTNYSHIVVLGGAVSAYQEADYPFLREEFKLLETAIAAGIPVLGICLGSQILAKILGAPVYRGAAGREIGWCEVQLTPAARRDRLFHTLPDRFRVFQSHQDTFDIPAGCVRLAESSKYPNQGFCYQDNVWAMQFHLEIDHQVLSDCASVIRQEILDSQVTETTIEELLAAATIHAAAVVPLADQLMQQFLQVPSPAFIACR